MVNGKMKGGRKIITMLLATMPMLISFYYVHKAPFAFEKRGGAAWLWQQSRRREVAPSAELEVSN